MPSRSGAPRVANMAPLRTGGGRSVSAHGNRDSHRIGRADRLGIRAPSGRAGIRRGRNRERHAQPVLRPRGLDLAGDRRADLEPRRLPLARARHPRRRRGRARCSPSTPARSRSSSTPPRSRRTTGRRASRRPTSASTPTAPSTCSRPRAQHCPDAPFIFCSTNKVYGDTPEPAAARRSSRRGSSCPSRTTTSRESTPRCRSTSRPTPCSAPRRPPPTCWCRSTGATSRCRRSAFAAAA